MDTTVTRNTKSGGGHAAASVALPVCPFAPAPFETLRQNYYGVIVADPGIAFRTYSPPRGAR